MQRNALTWVFVTPHIRLTGGTKALWNTSALAMQPGWRMLLVSRPGPTRRVWAARTAELVETASADPARELAAVMLMDTEAARAALAAAPHPARPARDFIEGLYLASRSSPQIVRRAADAAVVTVTVWGRVYAL